MNRPRQDDAPLAPQNLDAEEAVLGAMLLSSRALSTAVEIVSREDFYRETHAKIFEAAVGLHANDEGVDAITLAHELERRGHLGEVGGRDRVNELAALVPAADGAVTFGQLYAAQPFGNEMVTMNLSGAQIRAAIEEGLDDSGHKELLAPSAGLVIRYDLASNTPTAVVPSWSGDITALAVDAQGNLFFADGLIYRVPAGGGEQPPGRPGGRVRPPAGAQVFVLTPAAPAEPQDAKEI